MREIVHVQAGQCGNQIGAKVIYHYQCTFPPSCSVTTLAVVAQHGGAREPIAVRRLYRFQFSS
jgi:putative component of membrane protein insertase Oxa1/YidC/SpoIIIJ protein YidD